MHKEEETVQEMVNDESQENDVCIVEVDVKGENKDGTVLEENKDETVIEENKDETVLEENKDETVLEENKGNTLQNPKLYYRVKVSGLPRFYSEVDPMLTEFKKMLREELNLNFHYIRSPKKGNSWLYITFTNQDDQERALTLLKHYIWKNRTIVCTVVVADAVKRKGGNRNDSVDRKKPKLDIPLDEQILMSTIPYHSVAYEEQLLKKSEEAACHLKWVFELIQKRTCTLSGWIEEQITKYGKNLPFALEEVKASPVVDGYRNRCEFRVGINPQNQEITVGYNVDNQEDGSIGVAPPDSLRHLPKQMIEVVKEFEKFVKESPYRPNMTETNPNDKGLWRHLLVRINKKGEMIIIIMVQCMDFDTPNLDQIKNLITNYFVQPDKQHLNIVSIYVHLDKDKVGVVKTRKSSKDIIHVWGATYLDEDILDLKIEITPNFYFHWNTYGAEQLYNAVSELAGVDSETTVLDLCCGSGGMGLTLAKHCKNVLGVELMDVNVEDAKKIANKNGLTNCEFLHGKIDDMFPQVLEKCKDKKVVPILDPPKSGISQRMIINLRNMKEAEKLIYVCSNHKLPLKNFLDLGTVDPGLFLDSNPFVPTRIIPVDMSPHALRCELVILCERVDMKNIPKPTRERQKSTARNNLQQKKKRSFKNRFGYHTQRSYSDNYSNGYNSFSSPLSARDSLYHPPLRRALYQEPQRGFSIRGVLGSKFNDCDDFHGPGRRMFNPLRRMDDYGERFGIGYNRYNRCDIGPRGPGIIGRGVGLRGSEARKIPSLLDAPLQPPSNFDNDISRYTNFHHAVEDAIDSSYPQFRNNRFSFESAFMEREERTFQAGLSRGLTNGSVQYDNPRQLFRSFGNRGKRRGGTWL